MNIRKEMKEKREALEEYQVQTASQNVSNKIKALECYQKAEMVACYSPLNNEIRVELDKRVCYPKVNGDEMDFYEASFFVEGFMRIMEPIGPKIKKEDIDIIIVPLLAIDKDNNRIGYGKGYYDRYLKDFKGIKIGVGYPFQKVDTIIPNEWDIPLDLFIEGEY